jgi:hypothetical protein
VDPTADLDDVEKRKFLNLPGLEYYTASNFWKIINLKLEKMWKEAVVTQLKISRRLPRMNRKTSKNLSLVTRCPGQDWNRAHFSYQKQVLQLQPTCSDRCLSMDRSVKHVTVRSPMKPLKIAVSCQKGADGAD